jgi:hypothetical protein
VTLEPLSRPSAGGRAEAVPPASSGGRVEIGWAVLLAAAIPVVYVLVAYASMRLALDWFPPIDWRHDTDPDWVLPVALFAPLVLVAVATRFVTGRATAGLRGWHWALSGLLASLLLVLTWRRWVDGAAASAGQVALGVGVFFAFIGPGLWLGGWCRGSLLRARAARETARLTSYPVLDRLMGAWFPPDYDSEGETVVEIVGAFRAVTPPDERAALRAEIASFIAAHPDDLEQAFESTFRPGVSAAACSGSTRAFLDAIDSQLEA